MSGTQQPLTVPGRVRAEGRPIADAGERAVTTATGEVVTIRPPRTLVIGSLVTLVIGGLVLLGVVATVLDYQGWVFFGDEQFQRLFSLDREYSIPATVSVLGLASCAAVLALLAAARHFGGYGYGLYWLVLALGFAYLAIDEGSGLHEVFTALMNGFSVTQEYAFLNRAWVLVGGTAALVVGVLYVPFLRHLPRRYAVGMFVAGAMYVMGAVVLEMLGADAVADEASIRYRFLMIAEEALEMSGVGIFLVLLWSLARETPWRLESPAARSR